MIAQIRRYHRYTTGEALQADVVSRLAALADDCIHNRGRFCIVLAGGSTPQAVYRALCGIATDWAAWHVYFGDERCLPAGDPGRNDTMAHSVWLSRVPIPRVQVHAIPAERGAAAGAAAYAERLADVAQFDLVLLGLGEDGHTASLFPGQAHAAGAAVLAVHEAPKPPPDRISLSAAALGNADHVWFLVTGAGKREALHRWQQGEALPASMICPAAGVDIFTDISPG